MIRLALMRITAALMAWLGTPMMARAQARPAYAEVVIAQSVRDSLAAWWNETNVYQTERAYCLSGDSAALPHNGRGYLLYKVDRAKIDSATPYIVVYECPLGTVDLHTHTPTSCAPIAGTDDHDLTHCVIGGPDAWICEPSGTDQQTLDESPDLMALIQCDKHALILYSARHHPAPPSGPYQGAAK